MSVVFEIIPLLGVKIGSKTICLGAPKEKMNEVLGDPQSIQQDSYYYFESELRVDFDSQGRVEFIEFLAGVDGNIQPQIYGVNAFQAQADSLYELLWSENSGEVDDTESGYSYSFLNINVGIYRERTPDDIRAMIEDTKEEGAPICALCGAYPCLKLRSARHGVLFGFLFFHILKPRKK